MIIQWILQILACAVVGCIIGYFGTRITNKLRVFLFRKRSNFNVGKERYKFHNIVFHRKFGFYYEDVIKYAPEYDVLMASMLLPELRDKDEFKMFKMGEIYDAIRLLEQVDIIKFKQTIENIKIQKALENIDG